MNQGTLEEAKVCGLTIEGRCKEEDFEASLSVQRRKSPAGWLASAESGFSKIENMAQTG